MFDLLMGIRIHAVLKITFDILEILCAYLITILIYPARSKKENFYIIHYLLLLYYEKLTKLKLVKTNPPIKHSKGSSWLQLHCSSMAFYCNYYIFRHLLTTM